MPLIDRTRRRRQRDQLLLDLVYTGIEEGSLRLENDADLVSLFEWLDALAPESVLTLQLADDEPALTD